MVCCSLSVDHRLVAFLRFQHFCGLGIFAFLCRRRIFSVHTDAGQAYNQRRIKHRSSSTAHPPCSPCHSRDELCSPC